jgi:glutathione S-transferase
VSRGFDSKSAVLFTIPFSHYCEKARWALEYAGVPFEERGHAPGLNRFATARFGGSTVPLMVRGSMVLSDSTDIVALADREAASREQRLLPDEPDALKDALALEDRFDRRMGIASRAWAYSYFLPEVDRLLPYVVRGIPPLQAALVARFPSALAALIRRGLRIGPTTRAWARTRIQEDLDFVAERLADGRRYLVGEQLSTADLTFAALAAPALFPEQYGGPLPPLDALPRAMADEVTALRDSVAGAFALRIYRDHRRA